MTHSLLQNDGTIQRHNTTFKPAFDSHVTTYNSEKQYVTTDRNNLDIAYNMKAEQAEQARLATLLLAEQTEQARLAALLLAEQAEQARLAALLLAEQAEQTRLAELLYGTLN